jgi:hypothetical protein
VGLRKLLARKPAEDPLKRLAELGRETGRYHPRQFRHGTGESDAAPSYLSPVDEKVGLVSGPAARISTTKAKRAPEPPRSRSGYVWVSQRSRAKRAAWADFTDQTF